MLHVLVHFLITFPMFLEVSLLASSNAWPMQEYTYRLAHCNSVWSTGTISAYGFLTLKGVINFCYLEMYQMYIDPKHRIAIPKEVPELGRKAKSYNNLYRLLIFMCFSMCTLSNSCSLRGCHKEADTRENCKLISWAVWLKQLVSIEDTPQERISSPTLSSSLAHILVLHANRRINRLKNCLRQMGHIPGEGPRIFPTPLSVVYSYNTDFQPGSGLTSFEEFCTTVELGQTQTMCMVLRFLSECKSHCKDYEGAPSWTPS